MTDIEIAKVLIATQKLAKAAKAHLNFRARQRNGAAAYQISALVFHAFDGENVIFRDINPNLDIEADGTYYRFRARELATISTVEANL